MKTLQNHIYSLLFDYEYVTIPNFGSFISHYVPATIQENGLLTPPSKRVGFNSLLKLDDGILITSLAKADNVSVEEATQKVKSFVESVLTTLYQHEVVIFENVGSFLLNNENKIEFLPFDKYNFLGDSFGLESFLMKSLVANPSNKEQEIDFEEATEDFRLSLKKKRNTSKLKYVFYSLPLLALLASVVFISNDNGVLLSKASFNPFQNLDFFAKTEQVKPVTQPVIEAIKAPETRYYVIVGSFRTQANAEKQVTKLVNSGFEAAHLVMPQTENDLIKVVAMEVVEEWEAQDAIPELKKITGEKPVLVEK